MVNEILTAAIEYKNRGWIIHPLSSPKHIDPETGKVAENAGKAVLIKNWSQKETVTDAELTEWFTNKTPYFTDCNIGLQCGKRSDVTVLDLDHMLFIEELFNGFDLVTLRSKRTEGRGHVYFKYIDKFPSSKHHCLGIEVLNDAPGKGGNNVVIAPSVHKSGDVYKWNDPTTPIIAMPQALQDNLMRLFAVEAELKKILAKCRTCFRKFLDDYPDNIPDVHGMTGRRYLLAIATDLKKNGAKEPHIKMLSRLLYQEKYNEARTLSEWSNVDETKPWQCATMRSEFPAYIDTKQCERCRLRREDFKGEVQQTPTKDIVLGEKICGTCRYCPGNGAGGCKSPDTKIIQGKQKRNKHTLAEDAACDKYLAKPEKVKKIKDTSPKKLEPDQELERAMGMYTDRIQLAEELQKIIPFYFDESRNYWMWKKDVKYYKMIDETDILSCVRHNSREYVVSSTLKNEIIESIRITGRERKVLDVEKNWLRFNDKGYDLKTKEYFDPKPTHFHSAPIPHNIGNSYESPVIDALFMDWVGDRKEILYEIAAYCLLDDYPIHRMFILFGGGRNGKGQFMEFLTRLVGERNTTSTELDLLMKSRFEAAKLYKKKLALIGETDFSAIKDTAKIKKITGDDMIGGEFKQKKPFDFKNTAKIIISTNSIPETLDKTDAFFSRCNIIEFKNRFDISASVIDLIPEKEYENFIKNVVEHTLPTLLVRGVFKDEGTIEEKAEKYEKLSNPFSSFKDRELIEDIDSDIPVWVVREMYEEFCALNKFRKLGEKEFTMTLNKAGITTKKTRFGEKTWNAVIGFKTKNPRVWSLTEEAKSSSCSICSTPYDKIIHIGKEVQPTGTCRTCGTLAIQKALKEKYDLFNKPESILDLGRMQETMKLWITTEFEGSEKLNCARIVEDYCHARMWC